jgi:tripartite-type tricarboxylate transporter receptor subunit TctC
VARAVRSAAMGERMAARGLEPGGSTPEQYNAQIRQEIDKWAAIVKTANIKFE